MKITRDNYEAFLLDLSEGNLSDELIIELYAFLEENPDLETLTDLNTVPLKADSHSFQNSTGLYMEEINNKNRSFFFIAFHEGDLSRKQEAEVLKFTDSNPQYKEEFEKFRRSKLKASTESFSGKKALFDLSKENSMKSRILYLLPRVAAAGIILFIGMQLFTNKLIEEDKSFSQRTKGQTTILAKVDSDSLQNSKFKITDSDTNSIITEQVKTIKKTFKPQRVLHTKSNNSEFIALEKKEILLKDNVEKIENDLPVLNNPPLENLVSRTEKSLPLEIKDPDLAKSSKPQTISTLLKDKTGINEILNDEGRPSLVALLNKGGEKIVGEELIAQTSTETSKRTVFKIGSFKVERITGK